MEDLFNLQRFVVAQNRVYASVLQELANGEKTSHWMWYVFPQIRGLGKTPMSREYAITSANEATAYSEHPILGARLTECTQLVLAVEGRTAYDIFESPDDLKFRSCMTLFERTAKDASLFRSALDKYFDGKPDSLTVDILAHH